METVPLDEDEKYYMQLLTFTLGIGMEVLHLYFEQKILKEEEFYMFLERNKHYLFHDFYSYIECCECFKNSNGVPSKRGFLNKSQFLKLFDINPLTEQDHFKKGSHDEIMKDCLCRISAKSSNDVDCMDIPLMYEIIKSCFLNNRKTFHGNPNFLITIKDTRNFLAHAPGKRISKTDFDSYLAETEKAILGIASAVGSFVTKMYKRKIDAFKKNDLSLNKVKEIIESSTDEVKKNLQLLIDDQQKNAALVKQVKDELLEQLIKHKDELSIDIGNLRFDITQCNLTMSTSFQNLQKETFNTQDRMSQSNTACSSEVKVTEEGQHVKKCRVEWRLQTPDTWNLNEIKETLEKFSGVLRPWFEIEFVHVGSLVIKTLVPKEVLDNRDQMKKSIQAFLEKVVDVCHINTELTTVIKVDLVVSDESVTTVKKTEVQPEIVQQPEKRNECENCQQKDDIISALKNKIYEMSQELSAYDSVASEKDDDSSSAREAQAAVERQPEWIQLRQYQLELAEIALSGENTIICAESGAGKTYVSFHVIERHLLNNPKGKVVFISSTNIRLGQQYDRACYTLLTPINQGSINIWKAEDDDNDFITKIQKANLIFATEESVCNHLMDAPTVQLSIRTFTLMIMDECRHAYGKSVYNELMSYYRMAKYGEERGSLPQIIGLISLCGLHEANDLTSAKNHLKQIMAHLDVSKFSVVKRNKEELFQYTAISEKVVLSSTTRQHEPVTHILLGAMEYVESKMNSRIVLKCLAEKQQDIRDLHDAIGELPIPRTDIRYLRWIIETKRKVEHVLHRDKKVPRLLHACLRHLELYVECLEINSLLGIDQVREVILQGYADKSYENQNANTDEEMEILIKLKDVYAEIRNIDRNIEGETDIQAIIQIVESEFQRFREDSRFIIGVKTRATANILSKKLPAYLCCTNLTGLYKSEEEGDKQINVLERFRNGEHLCIATAEVGYIEANVNFLRCNMIISYKCERPDEIGIWKMCGTIGRNEGREHIAGDSTDVETEKQNIQQQYLMAQALEEISNQNIAKDIAIAEKNIFETEQIERMAVKLKKRKGYFSVHCKYCGVVITDSNLMRHVNKKFYFVCDKQVLARVDRRPISTKKQTTIDGFQKLEKAYGLECRHHWGSILMYKASEFLALAQDDVKIFDRQTGKFIDCRKWSDLVFNIEQMSDDDLESYKK